MNLEKNKHLTEYKHKWRPQAISLGNNYGVAEFNSFSIAGKIVSFMKKMIEWFIGNFKKKVFAIEILGNKESNLERISKSITNINRIINEF